MPRSIIRSLFAVLTVTFACHLAGLGQESIRPSATGSEAAEARKGPQAPKDYNLKLGPVTFDATGALEIEANDNIGISEKDRESDIVIRPSLHIGAFWQVTRLNALNINIGLGFAKFLSHPELDSQGILVDPGSVFSYDFFIGDVKIGVHDKFAVLQNPVDEPGLSNVGKFDRIQNSIGFDVLWDLNDMKVVAGYDHFNFWSISSEFDYLNRSEEQVFSSVSFDFNDANRAGVDLSGAWVSYQDNFNNDGLSANSGLFWETQLSNYLKLRVAGGAQFMFFNDGGQNSDNGDFSGLYANAALAHRLNAYWTHSLSAGHEARLGLAVNYNVFDYLRYSASWRTSRWFTTTFEAFYEHGNESGPDLTSERLSRYGGGVSLACPISRRSTVTLGYQFTNKDSDVPLRSYFQNRVLLGVSYDF